MSNIINTLLDSRIDYNSVSQEYFKHWTFISGIITGCMVALIVVFLHLRAYKTTPIKFKESYPQERLIYIIDNSIFSVFVVNFFIGSSIGFFLIPFFCFKNLDFSLKIILFALCIGFLLYEILIMYTSFYVLSDKQICLFNPYKIFKDSIRKIHIKYGEIKEVKCENYSKMECLVIKLKNGKLFDKIAGRTKLKEAKAIIEGKIER